MGDTVSLKEFIEHENAFTVMGRFRKEGILTDEETKHAKTLDRDGWVKFMKEKAFVED